MRQALAKGALIVGSARLASNIIGVISNISMARLLTPDDFGLVGIAGAVWMFVFSIVEFPINGLLLQIERVEPAHFDTAWTVGFVRVVIVSMLTWLLAYPVSLIYSEPRIIGLMLCMGVVTLSAPIRSPRMIEYTKALRFDLENKILVAQKVAGAVVGILIAYFTHSYWAILIAIFAADLSGHILSQWFAPYRPRWSTYDLRFFVKQGFWLTLSSLVITLNARVDAVIVGYFGNQAMLGRYSIGSNLASLPTRETLAPLSQTLVPSFALIKNDVARTRSGYQQAQAILFAIALPTGVGMAYLAPFIVARFLGQRWAGAEVVIQPLSVLFASQSLGVLSNSLAFARGENRLLSIRNTALFAVRIPSIVIGLIFGGLGGCLIGLCVAGFIDTIVMLFIAARITGVSVADQVLSNSSTLIATAAMALAASMTASITGAAPTDISYALVCVLISVVSYAAARLIAAWINPKHSLAERALLQVVRNLAGRWSGSATR